ncbi:MAG: nucleotidyltransferase [Leptolyngbyaceae cyanobacterium CSU_1_4]|nr:nucleotidyltransferase [Leptolyngbyaceae cyanobacterium CSU_1_4]
MQRHEAIARILQHREPLGGLGVESLTLFGSVARNEATNEGKYPIGVFHFSEIRLLLEDVLGCSVDLGTRNSLRNHLKETVLKDLIYVF